LSHGLFFFNLRNTTIYFSTTGLIHRIIIDAIPVSVFNGIGSETLAGRGQWIELNSTYQLVIPYEVKMSIPNDFHAAQKELRDAGLDL